MYELGRISRSIFTRFEMLLIVRVSDQRFEVAGVDRRVIDIIKCDLFMKDIIWINKHHDTKLARK